MVLKFLFSIACCALFATSIFAECEDIVLRTTNALAQPGSVSERKIHDLTLYKLNNLLSLSGNGVVRGENSWTIPCEDLSIDRAIIAAAEQNGFIDTQKVATLYHEHHRNTLEARDHHDLIRPTKAELENSLNFRSWPSRIVGFSNIKQKSRRIYRSPPGYTPQISVSETLNTTNGNTNAAVLETEVAIRLTRIEDDWDFYSYNRNGELSDYSTFPAGERSSPDICVACHYNASTRTISRFFPQQ